MGTLEMAELFVILLVGVAFALTMALLYQIRSKRKATNETAECQMLLNILCHDLANPLMILDHSARRLRTPLPPEHIDQKLHLKIKNTIDMLKDTLSKVQKLYESRHGKHPLLLEPLDPVQILSELKFIFEDLLIEKNLDLRVESFLDDEKLLLADRSLLKTEVLANLISNAIKFSPPHRNIDMFLTNEGEQIVIYIRDYGIGIPKEFLPHLFEIDSGTHRLGTQGEKGTGLGLSLARACVQMMEGSIEAESYQYVSGISGPGTMFTLRLKAASRQATAEA
jgi:signal transduction histidine kinase